LVTKDEFEKELMDIIGPSIILAQDVIEEKYGIQFQIIMDLQLKKGFHFDDEEGIGG